MIEGLTIVMPYYDSPEMLQFHLGNWERLPDEYCSGIEVIIVDDGSPTYPALDVVADMPGPDFPVRVYRILENIPWNHAGARNLGMSVANSGWILMTDIDHHLSVGNIMDLREQSLDPQKIYQVERVEMLSRTERNPINPHTDSFLLTKRMFWDIGGYDEDLTGFWNGPFQPFRRASKKWSKWHLLKGPYLMRFDNRVIPDANVTEWDRKGGKYDIKQNPTMLKKQQAAILDYKPKNPIRFEWKQVI